MECKGRFEFSEIEGQFGMDINQIFDGGLCYAVITTNQTNSVIKLHILSIANINCQVLFSFLLLISLILQKDFFVKILFNNLVQSKEKICKFVDQFK